MVSSAGEEERRAAVKEASRAKPEGRPTRRHTAAGHTRPCCAGPRPMHGAAAGCGAGEMGADGFEPPTNGV